MWACLNCGKDFHIPETTVKTIKGYKIPIVVCPYCGDEKIIDYEEYDFDDSKENSNEDKEM